MFRAQSRLKPWGDHLFHFTDAAGKAAVDQALEIAGLRFLSSTLLHVLASGIVGYYLARVHFFKEKFSLVKGIIIAGFLHGTYNTLTLASDSFQKISATFIVILLLALMAVWVNSLFYKLKRDFYR